MRLAMLRNRSDAHDATPTASRGGGASAGRWVVLAVVVLVGVSAMTARAALQDRSPSVIQFVFTSDSHYGLTRESFRGRHDVDAAAVNAALVSSVNALPGMSFPADAGLRGGEPVGPIDFLVDGGDIANREEAQGRSGVQSASRSWAQFSHDYLDGLLTRASTGGRTPVFVVPGNHDASNALGFYKPMQPRHDSQALASIFNLMLRPPQPFTPESLDYSSSRMFAVRDLGGIHFQFLHIWPDSSMRARMSADLAALAPETPVIVFTHDQPDVEAKHFINPNGAHDINATDQFENLLSDRFVDGPSVDLASTVEQAQLESFLVAHPNVTAYFHGNSNWHQAYEWNGPHRQARLHVFRADSPMKGAVSAADETQLSFEVVTIDTVRQTMTVRECLWNADGPDGPHPAWGDSVTVTLAPPVVSRAHQASASTTSRADGAIHATRVPTTR